MKLITGIVSLFTAYILIRFLPKALTFSTMAEYKQLMEEKEAFESRVRLLEEHIKTWTIDTHKKNRKFKTVS